MLAQEGAQRIGDRYLEMFAKECAAFGPWVAEHDGLEQAGREALALSRALKADRFSYVLLVCIASALRHRAPHAEIAALCQEALEIAERTSMTFAGPIIFGVYALIEPDPQRQRDWIAKGEALLAKSALAHNQAYFYRLPSTGRSSMSIGAKRSGSPKRSRAISRPAKRTPTSNFWCSARGCWRRSAAAQAARI